MEGGHCSGRSESDHSDWRLGVQVPLLEHLEGIDIIVISSKLSGVESAQEVE